MSEPVPSTSKESSDKYSDIEVIDEEGPTASTPTGQTLRENRESVSSFDLFFNHEIFSSMHSSLTKSLAGIDTKGKKAEGEEETDGSFDTDETLDLSPGPKTYIHIPSDSVNVCLNVCLLITCATVAGLGIGNYISSFQSHDTLKRVEQQLIDCLQNQQILLDNLSAKTEDNVYGYSSVRDYDVNYTTATTQPENLVYGSSLMESQMHQSVYLHDMQTSLTTAATHSLTIVSPPEEVEKFTTQPSKREEEEEIIEDSTEDVTDESNVGQYSILMKKKEDPVQTADKIGQYAYLRGKDHKLTLSDNNHAKGEEESKESTSTTYSYSKNEIPDKKEKQESVKNQKQSQNESKNSKAFIEEDQMIMFETSSVFEVPSEKLKRKSKKGSKRRSEEDETPKKSLIVWLLLSEEGTSKPSFLPQDYTETDFDRVVNTNFIPFMKESSSPSIVWLDKSWSSTSMIMKHWSRVKNLPPSQNPWLKYQEKVTRNFWSNLRKHVYKNLSRSRDSSISLEQQLKNEVIDYLLSLPSSSIQTAFSRVKSKVRKTLDRSRG